MKTCSTVGNNEPQWKTTLTAQVPSASVATSNSRCESCIDIAYTVKNTVNLKMKEIFIIM